MSTTDAARACISNEFDLQSAHWSSRLFIFHRRFFFRRLLFVFFSLSLPFSSCFFCERISYKIRTPYKFSSLSLVSVICSNPHWIWFRHGTSETSTDEIDPWSRTSARDTVGWSSSFSKPPNIRTAGYSAFTFSHRTNPIDRQSNVAHSRRTGSSVRLGQYSSPPFDEIRFSHWFNTSSDWVWIGADATAPFLRTSSHASRTDEIRSAAARSGFSLSVSRFRSKFHWTFFRPKNCSTCPQSMMTMVCPSSHWKTEICLFTLDFHSTSR